jgi:hypothetical protein
MPNKNTRITRHHIIPRSRGGTCRENNLCMVRGREHEAYHKLFFNKTPDEIIEYLIHEFWQDQWEWLDAAIERYQRKEAV